MSLISRRQRSYKTVKRKEVKVVVRNAEMVGDARNALEVVAVARAVTGVLPNL